MSASITAESFSSRGPTVTRYLDKDGNRLATPEVRPKPDLAGADGVAVSSGFDTGSPDLNPFFGTSAAAPSAAGVAAVLWSAKPSMSVDELYAILRNPRGMIDCTSAPGYPDSDCGFGLPPGGREIGRGARRVAAGGGGRDCSGRRPTAPTGGSTATSG